MAVDLDFDLDAVSVTETPTVADLPDAVAVIFALPFLTAVTTPSAETVAMRASEDFQATGTPPTFCPVSYTHLTLPTKRIV